LLRTRTSPAAVDRLAPLTVNVTVLLVATNVVGSGEARARVPNEACSVCSLGTIVRRMVAVALCEALVAVMTYWLPFARSLGMPEIAPVVASRESPPGSAGETVNLVAEPETLGISGLIATPTV
jgi:hypothetical protein